MHLCAALRIELQRGCGYYVRRLVIDHGVNVARHTSSGPTSKTRGSTSVPGMEQQSSVVVMLLQWDGVIYGRKTQNTVTFLKILPNEKVSWGAGGR